MKATRIQEAFPAVVVLAATLLLIPWLVGCATISNSGVQTFAAGVTTAKSQTDTAFQAVNDLTSVEVIEHAAGQPKLNDTNFIQVIDPQAMVVWDGVFSALQKYSQNLMALTSPTITKDYQDAMVNLAAQVKQTGDDLKNQKVTSEGISLPPSFAGAFTELGKLLLQEKAERDAKKILAQADPTIRKILTIMADTIGSPTNNLRGTVHAHWDIRKGEQKVAFISPSAKAADKLAIATKYAGLMNSENSQDLVLASLAKSLLALADAHHALAAGDTPGVSAAVAVVEAELQNTVNLTTRFEAANKPSK